MALLRKKQDGLASLFVFAGIPGQLTEKWDSRIKNGILLTLV